MRAEKTAGIVADARHQSELLLVYQAAENGAKIKIVIYRAQKTIGALIRCRATRIGKMIVVGHLFADDIGHLARRVMQANIVGARAARIGVKLGNAVFVIIVARASGVDSHLAALA